MVITLGSLVPIVGEANERIDQGTLLRFMGEMVWFPTAALEHYVQWEPIDDSSA